MRPADTPVTEAAAARRRFGGGHAARTLLGGLRVSPEGLLSQLGRGYGASLIAWQPEERAPAPIACRRRPSGDGGRLREVSARFEIPGAAAIELEHLVLDVNGTLTHRGDLIPGVAERIAPMRQRLAVHLLSADTRGQLGAVAERLAVPAQAISRGDEKRAFVERLGADQCCAVGNGLNDAPMLRGARLGIAIIGPEGASSAALAAAEVVCASITAALDLLLDPVTLASTLRP